MTCMSATESTKVSGRTRPRVTMADLVLRRRASPRPREGTPPSSRSRTRTRPRARRARPLRDRGAPRRGERRRIGSWARRARPGTACASQARPSGEAPRLAPATTAAVTRSRVAPSRPTESPTRIQAAAKPARRSSPDGVSPGPSPARLRAAQATDTAWPRTAASHRSRAGMPAAPTTPARSTPVPGPEAQRSGRSDSPAPSAITVARAVRSRSARSRRGDPLDARARLPGRRRLERHEPIGIVVGRSARAQRDGLADAEAGVSQNDVGRHVDRESVRRKRNARSREHQERPADDVEMTGATLNPPHHRPTARIEPIADTPTDPHGPEPGSGPRAPAKARACHELDRGRRPGSTLGDRRRLPAPEHVIDDDTTVPRSNTSPDQLSDDRRTGSQDDAGSTRLRARR